MASSSSSSSPPLLSEPNWSSQFSRQFISKLSQVFFVELIAVTISSVPVFMLSPSVANSSFVGAFTSGASVFLGLWIAYPVSEGHINPMMTLAFVITRRIHPAYLALYILAQTLGSFLAMGFGFWVSPYRISESCTYGMTLPGVGVSDAAAVVTEALTTFTFVLVHLASLDEQRETAWGLENGNHFPFAVMIVVMVNSALTCDISGGSMNPIRSIVAAIIQNNYRKQWIYFVGPLVGTVLACVIYETVVCPGASVRRTRQWLFCREFNRCGRYLETEDVETEQQRDPVE